MKNLFKAAVAGGAMMLAALGGSMSASAAEVTLSAASCFPIGSPPGKPFEAVVAAINEQGKGVGRDKVRASQLHKKACDEGDGFGCYRLARMHERGEGGLKRARGEARRLFQRACDIGADYACRDAKRLH